MAETALNAAAGSIHGDKLFEQRARAALPLLVRQAKAEKPVLYSQLASELAMPNPRNLNYVLGLIGNALLQLGAEWGEEIPPLQGLVINKETELPGEGFIPFAPDPTHYKLLTPRDRAMVADRMLQEVYSYPKWDRVLAHFGLPPLPGDPVAAAPPRAVMGVGESAEHIEFKRLVSQRPDLLGLPMRAAPGELEFMFGSGDAVDVLFRTSKEWVAVEVKSRRSSEDDVRRGLYQCVKYAALLCLRPHCGCSSDRSAIV
jgi:hypothetical protein